MTSFLWARCLEKNKRSGAPQHFNHRRNQGVIDHSQSRKLATAGCNACVTRADGEPAQKGATHALRGWPREGTPRADSEPAMPAQMEGVLTKSFNRNQFAAFSSGAILACLTGVPAAHADESNDRSHLTRTPIKHVIL